MGTKEEMVEKGPKTAMWIDGKWEENHLAGDKFTDDCIAGCHDRGGRITFVHSAQFPAFVRLKM